MQRRPEQIWLALMRVTAILVISAASILAKGQTIGTQTPPPEQGPKSGTLFGTNANLEGSQVDKGATLGIGPGSGKAAGSNGTTTSGNKKRKHRGEFAIAPIPMVNPSIGNGGGAAVLYSTRLDSNQKTPPSSFGMSGFGTGRGSWGFGLGGRLYLKDDRYRILAGGGGGEFNYSFFGIGSDAGTSGISIPLSQRSRAFLIEPKIRVFPDWYVGPRYHLITNQISLDSNKYNLNDLPVPLPNDLHVKTAALGLRVQRDTSDNPFYPRKGSLVDLTTDFFDPAFGGDRSYQNLTTSYDKYLGVGAKNVFAIHGTVCMVTNQGPFWDICELGMSKDLRGYQIGQFRDNRMVVGQAEYRRELFWRLGAVAFAGAGAVGKTFSQFGNAEPGGGFGLRVILAKQNHINLRVDYAWGDSSHATYVSLGEAF